MKGENPHESNNPEVTREILRQMREDGKSYANDSDNALSSTSVYYSYDKEKMCFTCHASGNVMGGSVDWAMSEAEMIEVIANEHIADLRASGFSV